jgi:hypothetical protein
MSSNCHKIFTGHRTSMEESKYFIDFETAFHTSVPPPVETACVKSV